MLHVISLLMPLSLQDDVPPFPDEQAFAIIQEQLGRPLEAVFSSISEQPVAAASLGQVSRASLHAICPAEVFSSSSWCLCAA